jgi:hypothetical protein
MKKVNRNLLFGAAMVGFLAFALGNPALALHDGGVAHCDACHTMHNSADNPATGTENNLLLKGSDASSTCLNCHNGSGSYHINSTDGSGVNGGGDFYWITKDYSVAGGWPGAPVVTYLGENNGHSVIAADFGMLPDANPSNATAPGGTYLASDLGCASCHDPHGTAGGGTAAGLAPISGSGSYGDPEPTDGSRLGNYRLLGDGGYEATGGYPLNNAAPIAAASGSDGASVDYGSGMSEWCANCHGDYINDSHKHPAGDGEHLNGFGDNYNNYVATGDFTGVQATAYDGLVPFERGVDTGGWDLDPTSTIGTNGNSNVMCLTCHRAHVSANQNAGRWDFAVELLTHSRALVSPDVTPGSAVYYKDGAVVDVATEYGEHQRSLCNKCHVQD